MLWTCGAAPAGFPKTRTTWQAWLAGHRERVEAGGGQVALHPVLTEFQELIDTDPVVRMYINQMIAQVPSTKPYRKRHLESPEQLLRLVNEVLTMAPEFGGSMVATPLGAILDWTMGTPAGFAAYRARASRAAPVEWTSAKKVLASNPRSSRSSMPGCSRWSSRRAR